jgi:elongator complex protein 3
MVKNVQRWLDSMNYTPEIRETARKVLGEVQRGKDYRDAVRHYPLPAGGYVPKHAVVAVYRQMVALGDLEPDQDLLARLRMKPIRTLSGVSTVTILTKPHPCPGQCIFCPNDVRMPKSYLPEEPGAARAFQNNFDPYLQVKSRLEAYLAVGHPIDKIELLILGGTWSCYPHDYQEWFIKRCFDAVNGTDSDTLEQAQQLNTTSTSRNVGLVIETRPEKINPVELARLRWLGVTKVQMGAQSLDDRILKLNLRGHTSAQTLTAVALLRAAGFKIVLHWMPNLLGATLESDHADFARLWQEYCPDEIKIYPTQLLENTELHNIWKRGDYQPYTTNELINLIADLKPTIPPYCRVNRIIRDIPSNYIVAGNKRTSLRQDILAEVARRGESCGCIRCHEVQAQEISLDRLQQKDFVYHPAFAEEHFLSFQTSSGKIAGYLRLSMPQASETSSLVTAAIPELQGAALIREVHVFGQSVPIGTERSGAAQHIGLGTRLLEQAEKIAIQHGYNQLAVISAVGTRLYYQVRGFKQEQLYMVKTLQ